MEDLSQFYSHTGRPAINQVQIVRSLILMVMLGFTSLTAWVEKLKADSLLAVLAGFAPASLAPLGSYFGLMDRLWSQPTALQKTDAKISFPHTRIKSLPGNPAKGKSFLISILGLPIPWPLMPWTMIRSLFIMKNGSNSFSGLRPSSLPYGTGFSPLTALPFPAMAPVSIPIPPLTGIKSANVGRMESSTAPAGAISPIPMLTGAGTAMKRSFISATPFTCSVPIIRTLALTCPCISVS